MQMYPGLPEPVILFPKVNWGLPPFQGKQKDPQQAHKQTTVGLRTVANSANLYHQTIRVGIVLGSRDPRKNGEMENKNANWINPTTIIYYIYLLRFYISYASCLFYLFCFSQHRPEEDIAMFSLLTSKLQLKI